MRVLTGPKRSALERSGKIILQRKIRKRCQKKVSAEKGKRKRCQEKGVRKKVSEKGVSVGIHEHQGCRQKMVSRKKGNAEEPGPPVICSTSR